jgi:cell division septation protein DedD
VGAFKKRSNAKKLVARLSKKGYSVCIIPLKSPQAKLYRVRLGKFPNKARAEKVAKKIKEEENLPVHIFKVED